MTRITASAMTKYKIGILSMQRVINYGSFMQAYALREMIRQNGCEDVSFIDIIPGRLLVPSYVALPKWRRYFKKLVSIIKNNSLLCGLRDFRFNRALESSIRKSWPILGLDNSEEIDFDCVVIGSDEVFNCCQGTSWGYTPQLFGKICPKTSKRIISYAGSFGYTGLEDLIGHQIDKEVGSLMKRLDAISVRDENSKDIVLKLTGRDAEVHLDPVLIYGYKREIADMDQPPSQERYLIVYTYMGRLKDGSEINAVRSFAKKNNLKVFSIMCRYDWCDRAILPQTPVEVLKWFKYADCIVTDTFHGSIFSIVTHSRFAAFVRPSNRNKLHYLLMTLNLECQEVKRIDEFDEIMQKLPDYDATEEILDSHRTAANNYMTENLI